MRGETRAARPPCQWRCYFNPLPSCEGRRFPVRLDFDRRTFQSTPLMRGETRHNFVANMHCIISIHSPHARGDCGREMLQIAGINFNPLPSREGRPPLPEHVPSKTMISIHSPHARGDTLSQTTAALLPHFNPLPSCEGRQHKPPKIHPNLRQLTQQNHDTPLFGALQASFCGAEPDIRGAKRLGKP